MRYWSSYEQGSGSDIELQRRRYACLFSSLGGGALPEARVIVADNGSTDDSVARVRALFPAVEVIGLGTNYGFAEGTTVPLRR